MKTWTRCSQLATRHRSSPQREGQEKGEVGSMQGTETCCLLLEHIHNTAFSMAQRKISFLQWNDAAALYILSMCSLLISHQHCVSLSDRKPLRQMRESFRLGKNSQSNLSFNDHINHPTVSIVRPS